MTTSITTDADNIASRVPDGFYQTRTATKAEGWPEDSGDWAHLISATHTNEGGYWAMQMAGGFWDNEHFFVRKTVDNGNQPWNELYHSGFKLPLRTSPGTYARAQTFEDWNRNRPIHLNDVLKPGTYGSSDNLQPVLAELANKAREQNTSFELPAGQFLCNGPIDLAFTELRGAGVGNGNSTTLICDVDSDLIVANNTLARGLDFRVTHNGRYGRAIALYRGDAHHFERVAVNGENGASVDPLVEFYGSNIRLDNLAITNRRSGQAYSLRALCSEATGININNVISGLYMGGMGRGIFVGSSDGTQRPEGLHLIAPQSVVTGGPAIVVDAILQLAIVAPMLDQVKEVGILINGGSPHGVDGVQVIGGWIGSSNGTDPNATGIKINGAGAGNVTVDGTALRYLRKGIDVIENSGELTVSDSVQFTDITSGACISAPNTDWIRNQLFVGDRIRRPAGVNLVEDRSTGRRGEKRVRKAYPVQTAGFNGYTGGDHGLVAPPSKINLSTEIASAVMEAPRIALAQKDLNNVVFAVNQGLVVQDGGFWIHADMEV